MRVQSAFIAVVLFFLAVLAFFCTFAPNFATASNFEDLMAGFSFIAILAIGESFPILLRGIDLSVGATLALAGMVAFDLTLMFDVPGYVAIPITLAVATLCGAINGALIVKLRLQPFIATLSTLAAYRGLVYAISGRQLVPELSTTPLSDPWIMGLDTYFDIGSATGLSSLVEMPWVPLSFFIMIATLVVFGVMLGRTRFGRDIYTVGGNAEAARLAGINVGRTIITAYAICGFCAGLAALLMIARLSTTTESLGMGMEMSAIAAAVIGGTSLFGGRGSAYAALLGIIVIQSIASGLTMLNLSSSLRYMITGAVLAIAVVVDSMARQSRVSHGRA